MSQNNINAATMPRVSAKSVLNWAEGTHEAKQCNTSSPLGEIRKKQDGELSRAKVDDAGAPCQRGDVM